MLIVFYTVIFI